MKTKSALTFIPMVFSVVLLSSGCEKKTAEINAPPESKAELRQSTKPLQAADLVGYDGTRLGKSVDRIIDANARHDRELGKMVETGPDQ
jgi:hypothetical protein